MDLKWNPTSATAFAATSEHQLAEELPEQRAASLERSSRHNFFMDGPGRLTSALQLISAAAAVASNKRSSSTPPPSEQLQPPSAHHRGFSAGQQQALSNASSTHSLHQEEDAPSFEHGQIAATTVVKTARTIVASDNEVSNGFVKDGKRLPYVFEATESGSRKRSSKILPVCGVCGKRFVCVTTMKRHLVTHTGEKPFSCKVCGKQYTQKGNLRVHERTHRNDRPFECNICHQKFYRKEPMQKHQWRQHGIVHFKGRPPGCLESNNMPLPPTTTMGPPMGVTNTSPEQNGVLYNTIVDRIKQQSLETRGESSRHLDGPPPAVMQMSRLQQQKQEPVSYSMQPENLSTSALPLQRLPLPLSLSMSVPLPLNLKQQHPTAPAPGSSQQLPSSMSSAVPNEEHSSRQEASPPAKEIPMEFNHAKLSLLPVRTATDESTDKKRSPTITVPFSSATITRLPKMSPAAQLVSAAMAELNAQRNNMTKILTETTTDNSVTLTPSPTRLLTALQIPLANNNNSTNNAILATTETQQDIDRPDHDSDSDKNNDTDVNMTTTQNPLRMKKMLAHAYQREAEELQQHQLQQQTQDEEMKAAAEEQQQQSSSDQDSDSSCSTGGPSFSSSSKELVECQCKGCGHVFAVQDPYNFRCSHCGVKYTSLPTHMIADPMQCIGCCEVFPHKPALKAHQMNASDGPDRERPFRCCKCGYSFRQKAHLQKHQWRIHRRKLEEEPAAANGKPRTASESSTGAAPFTITLQDIIDRGVEHSMARQRGVETGATDSSTDNAQPLDLSPTKSLLLSSPSPLASSGGDSSSSSIMLSSGGGLATDANLRQLASSLPALHNQNQPLPMIIIPERSSSADSPSDVADPPFWKRQRTAEPAKPTVSPTHSSLPPIAGLQKPPTWRSSPSSGPPSPSDNSLVKSKYMREQMSSLIPGADVRTV